MGKFLSGILVRKFRLVSIAIVAMAIILGMLQPSYSQLSQLLSQAPSSEIRGVWLTNIDSDVFFATPRLAAAIQRLHQLNFNAIYPTVWNWGYTLYPSDVMGRVTQRVIDPDPGLQGRDVLQETINHSHRHGLAVIPWFEFGFMAPADSELASRKAGWLTSRSDGSQIVKQGIHDRVWLIPWHPEVRQFMKELILEICQNYDVDGIQFDDHFGLPVELGYDPYTIELYKKEHNGRTPPTNFRDAAWVKWRADKITATYAELYQTIKSVKPSYIVSLSPNPYQFAYSNFLTDWKTWEEKGWVDELLLQVYRDNMSSFLREIEQPEVVAASRRIPVATGILTGIRTESYSSDLIRTQAAAARSRRFAGLSFFYYETLWNNADEPINQRQNTFSRLFPTPAVRPRRGLP
jgi:uncharacterized lipoprotein YddW (UPF0748 family)